MEHSGSDGDPVAIEYIDYGTGSISFNYACAVAKEQQVKDRAEYRVGQKVTGIFYPETEPTNADGTYKRLVYSQIRELFYNNYRDPTKIWGMERIDFDQSQTRKYLTDQFQLFDIPRYVFGEKIAENTVVMIYTSLDNDYVVTDDGYNNLFAGTNLFSRQQEIGEFLNNFRTGSNHDCDDYFGYSDPTKSVSGADYMSVSITYLSGTLGAEVPHTESNSVGMGFLSGSTSDSPFSESAAAGVGFLSGSLDDFIVTDAGARVASIGFLFGSLNAGEPTVEPPSTFAVGVYTASVVTTILGTTGSIESMSFVSIGFDTGSIFNTVIPLSSSGDSMSFVSIGFDTGSVFETTMPVTMSADETNLLTIGFDTGSIQTFIKTSSQFEYVYEVRTGFLSGTLT